MRLIDADKVIINIANIITMGDMFEAGVAHGIHKAVNELLDAPTIEAEPVRHGRWVPLSYDGYADGYAVYDEWECSECHFSYNGEGEPPLNYCPNCGAKMEGKNEDDVD